MDVGHKYRVFFHLERDTENRGTDPHHLDLFVESAYQKKAPVPTKCNFPFGKAAERIAKGIRF